MYAICPVVKSALTRTGGKKKTHKKQKPVAFENTLPLKHAKTLLLKVGCPLNRAYGLSFPASLNLADDGFRSLLLKLCHKRCHDPALFCLVSSLDREAAAAGAAWVRQQGGVPPHAPGGGPSTSSPSQDLGQGVKVPVRTLCLWTDHLLFE